MDDHPMLANVIRAHLVELAEERVVAEALGMTSNGAYMADLEQEIAASRRAFVGASVTEIAVFRGELLGRKQG